MLKRSIAISVLLLALLSTAAFADYNAGVAAFKAKDYPKAVTEFQASIEELKAVGAEEDPQYFSYYLMLGQSLYRAKDYVKSIEPLKMALRLKEGDVNTQLILGQVYYRMKDYRNAASTFSKMSLSSLPESSQAQIYQMLANSYENLGNDGLALSNMEKAALLNPKDAKAHYNYGQKALSQGYTDDAAKALEKAVSLKPNDANYRRGVVAALVLKSRETRGSAAKKATYLRAVSHATKLASLDPSHDSYLQLAETQLGAQQYAAAVTALDKAIGKKSSEWLPYYYKGQAYTALKEHSKAVPPLKTALTKNPSEKQKRTIHRQLGFVYEKLKDLPHAIESYRIGGDAAGLARVEENDRIAAENEDIDSHNAEIEELERQKLELEQKLRELPGGGSTTPR